MKVFGINIDRAIEVVCSPLAELFNILALPLFLTALFFGICELSTKF